MLHLVAVGKNNYVLQLRCFQIGHIHAAEVRRKRPDRDSMNSRTCDVSGFNPQPGRLS
jgi:hypothetical protein